TKTTQLFPFPRHGPSPAKARPLKPAPRRCSVELPAIASSAPFILPGTMFTAPPLTLRIGRTLVSRFLLMERSLKFRIIFPLLGINLACNCLSFLKTGLFDKYLFGDIRYRYLLADQLLDFVDVVFLRRVTEGNGIARLIGPAGTPDTVHIVFDNDGHIEIDHVAYIADVQS